MPQSRQRLLLNLAHPLARNPQQAADLLERHRVLSLEPEIQAQNLGFALFQRGEHAFHIHQTGRCDAKDGFKSAGDHYAGDRQKHGFKVEGGPHAGDMMNKFVGSDGQLRAHVINTRVTLTDGENTVFDSDGSALILHAKGDDYSSQPSGNAGDRIFSEALLLEVAAAGDGKFGRYDFVLG